MIALELNAEEKNLIARLNTPEKIARYMHEELTYDKQDDYPDNLLTNRSFRRVIRDKKAHCLEGVFFSAAIMREYGYFPYMVSMDAAPDFSHNIFVYKDRRTGRIGSLSLSRDSVLWERKPAYNSLKDLILSYYYVYTEYAKNLDDMDKVNDDDAFITLRGYSHLIDLNKYLENRVDWVTGEKNVDKIEEDLYSVVYRKIVLDKESSKNRPLYYTSPDGFSMIPAKKPKDVMFGMF